MSEPLAVDDCALRAIYTRSDHPCAEDALVCHEEHCGRGHTWDDPIPEEWSVRLVWAWQVVGHPEGEWWTWTDERHPNGEVVCDLDAWDELCEDANLPTSGPPVECWEIWAA